MPAGAGCRPPPFAPVSQPISARHFQHGHQDRSEYHREGAQRTLEDKELLVSHRTFPGSTRTLLSEIAHRPAIENGMPSPAASPTFQQPLILMKPLHADGHP